MSDALDDLIGMLDIPRYVHNADLETRRVTSADDLRAALKEGWSIKPVGQKLVKGKAEHVVSTPEEKAVALAQGWKESDAAPEPELPIKGKKSADTK